MREQELRSWLRQAKSTIRAIQNDIHAICEQYNANQNQQKPPTRIDGQVQIEVPPTITEYYESESREGPKDRRRDKMRLGLEILAFGAAIIAAIFTYKTLHQVTRQADAASNQLTFSTESFRMDERAFVEISRIELTRTIPAEEKFHRTFLYEVRLKNVGKTIATSVSVKAVNPSGGLDLSTNAHGMDLFQNDKFLDSKTGENAHVLHINSIPAVIAPGAETPLSFRFSGSEPQSNGKLWSFFIGRVDYTSVFGTPHWMKFCMFVSNAAGELRYCETGNDEDKTKETPSKQ